MRVAPFLFLALLGSACASSKGSHAPQEQARPAPPAESAPMVGALPGDRIPAFLATVRRPAEGAAREERFDSILTAQPTVYIVNSTTCPYCAEYVGEMKEIEVAYMARGVDVVHVYPNRAETPEEKTMWHAGNHFRGGQILDSDANIARLLEADRTPTVYLVDAKGLILYRGAIDDGHGTAYLADAIDAYLAGKPIEVTSTEPLG
jgi:hypothetical protein